MKLKIYWDNGRKGELKNGFKGELEAGALPLIELLEETIEAIKKDIKFNENLKEKSGAGK